MKQTIAIMGATGNMGSSLTQSLAKGNYRLLLFARDYEKTLTFAEEVRLNHSSEIEVMDCSYDACWEADVIISAVPYAAERELAEKIREVANQKVVISIANPLNETFDGLITPAGTSAAEELQKLLPNSKVVKAFNTTFAADFSKPVIAGKKVDAFIAGNDGDAIQTVTELVETVGFNPVVTGDLPESRTLEAMQLLLIKLGLKYNYNWLAGWKILHNE